MIQPTPRALLVLLAGIPLAIAPAVISPGLWVPWAAALGAFSVVLGLDALLAAHPRAIAAQAEIPDTIGMGAPRSMTVHFRAARSLPRIEVLAHLDPLFEPQPLRSAIPQSRTAARLDIHLVPLRRGTHRVHEVQSRWCGPLGLARRVARLPLDREVRVVPDIHQVRNAALRFFGTREFLTGSKSVDYLGEGSEFDSLREYLPGLNHRAIDWKASARHTKLLVRDYRAERNHQVVLAFDSGHLMAEPLEGVPRIDHAINAGLLLGYVILRSGDRVGLFAFDSKVRRFTQPRSGVATVSHLLAESSTLDYSTEESNFTLGLSDLSRRLRRRTLIVLFTDFVDTVTAELMIDNLGRLARRHLVVFIAFEDLLASSLADSRPRDMMSLNRAVVAREIQRERSRVISRLRRLGVHCLVARPEQVSADLVNRYLDIKRRELV
jgi:uncharacterized protein (DUF58 family)